MHLQQRVFKACHARGKRCTQNDMLLDIVLLFAFAKSLLAKDTLETHAVVGNSLPANFSRRVVHGHPPPEKNMLREEAEWCMCMCMSSARRRA